MTTEAKPETTQTQQTTTPEVPKPATETVQTQTKETPKQEPVKAATTQAEPAKAGGGMKKHTASGDEDIPEDADLIELTSSALKRRLDRHSKKELRDRFGSDNPDEIKGKLDKLSKFEAKAEEDRQKQLTKEQQLEERARKAEERAEAAELREAAEKEDRMVDREDGRLKEIATNHIKMKYWKHVSRDLAEHLSATYNDDELEKLKDKDVDKWFAGYLKENPEFVKEAKADDVKKEPVTSGQKEDDRPEPEKRAAGGKNFKPGPGGMTPQESRAAAAAQGYSWR